MILYFSGTGNSKYVAQRMAEALNQSLLSMNDRIRSHDTSPVETDERLVIVTPTYAWRHPPSGAGLAAGDGVPRRSAGVVHHDLRQRDRPRRPV